tara:strand:+ start:271 stop:585 length:315 start_codon:yes stop_codon:yes gene_type:complete
MSSDKKNKFSYKEKLIDEIPEEFRDKESVPFDHETATIKDYIKASGFVDQALKILPKNQHEIYLKYVDSLAEKNQKYLEVIREKLKDPKITKELLRAIAAKKRS